MPACQTWIIADNLHGVRSWSWIGIVGKRYTVLMDDTHQQFANAHHERSRKMVGTKIYRNSIQHQHHKEMKDIFDHHKLILVAYPYFAWVHLKYHWLVWCVVPQEDNMNDRPRAAQYVSHVSHGQKLLPTYLNEISSHEIGYT